MRSVPPSRRRVLDAAADAWDWLTNERYERQPGRLRVWVPRSMVMLCWMVVVLGLACSWLTIAQGPTGAIFLALVGSLLAVIVAVQSSLPIVVADPRGITCWRGARRRMLSWDDIEAFELTGGAGTGAVLRIKTRGGRGVWVFIGLLAVWTESRARAARHLARQLSVFSESIGNGPVPWPGRVTYFTSGGDPVDI